MEVRVDAIGQFVSSLCPAGVGVRFGSVSSCKMNSIDIFLNDF